MTTSPSRSSSRLRRRRRRPRSRPPSRPRPGCGRRAGPASTARRCWRRGGRRVGRRGPRRSRSGRVRSAHQRRPVSRVYSSSSAWTCDLPVVGVVGRRERPRAHRRPLVGRRVDDRADRRGDRLDVGRIDRDPAAGLARDRAHPRVVRADGRDAGRHRLEELVRGRQVVVERVVLEQDPDDVGGGDPVEQLGRWHGRQDVDPALVLRPLRPPRGTRPRGRRSPSRPGRASGTWRIASISCSTPRPTEKPPW